MAGTKINRPTRRGKGFRRTASLLQPRIKGIGASRGFAVSRLLTHWSEIVGETLAKAASPVEVKYGREGQGATLTVLVKGAEAPMIEMQKERLRETVNACYGYNAIQKIRITQTAATGFAEPEAPFRAASKQKNTPQTSAQATAAAAPIQDPGLRAAVEALGSRILISEDQQQRSDT
ncbi:MAG: DUF721 domain-containing protein [Pseudomonadota bacterium]